MPVAMVPLSLTPLSEECYLEEVMQCIMGHGHHHKSLDMIMPDNMTEGSQKRLYLAFEADKGIRARQRWGDPVQDTCAAGEKAQGASSSVSQDAPGGLPAQSKRGARCCHAPTQGRLKQGTQARTWVCCRSTAGHTEQPAGHQKPSAGQRPEIWMGSCFLVLTAQGAQMSLQKGRWGHQPVIRRCTANHVFVCAVPPNTAESAVHIHLDEGSDLCERLATGKRQLWWCREEKGFQPLNRQPRAKSEC